MPNTDKKSWDITAPVTATGYVGKAAEEIRLLRESVADRLNKQHVLIADAGVGGEHLEGSARIFVGADEPTNLVVGSDEDVAIEGHTALAHGAVWADNDAGYVLKVYDDGDDTWHSVSYLALAGGTLTGNLAFSGSRSITMSNAADGVNSPIVITDAKESNHATIDITSNRDAPASSGVKVTIKDRGCGFHVDGSESSGTVVTGFNCENCIDAISIWRAKNVGVEIGVADGGTHIIMTANANADHNGNGSLWFDGNNLKFRKGNQNYTISMT